MSENYENIEQPSRRRTMLAAGGLALAGFAGAKLIGKALLPTADVFVARNQQLQWFARSNHQGRACSLAA